MFPKYLLPLLNTADAPISDPPASVEPPAPLDPPQATAPEPVDPPAPDPEPAKSPWYLQRLAQESEKARREAEGRAAAERRAAEAEALLQRMQSGKTDPAPTPQAPDRQAEIRAEAERMRFMEDIENLRASGHAAFGAGFAQTINILNAVGAASDDFVKDVFAVDKANAPVLLDQIAKDPEKAANLASLSSRQRIAELTRMSVAAAAPKVDPPVAASKPALAQTSRAPAPAPRVEPSASTVVDWRSDKASDADFDAGFQEMMKRRNARR